MMCYRFSCTLRPGPLPTAISLVESALPDTLRVLTAISRNRPPATPLQSALTELPFVTPPESALPKKGEGRSVPNRALFCSLVFSNSNRISYNGPICRETTGVGYPHQKGRGPIEVG